MEKRSELSLAAMAATIFVAMTMEMGAMTTKTTMTMAKSQTMTEMTMTKMGMMTTTKMAPPKGARQALWW